MSRTYRNLPTHCFKHPKGRKQAIINGARKKAIPPSPYEDEQINKEAFAVYTVVERMKDRFSEDEIIDKIVNKFKLSRSEAERIVRKSNG